VKLALAMIVLLAACGAPSLRVSVEDVRGQPVRIGERVTLVVLMSRAASEEAADLLRAIDERVRGREIEEIGIVDLRRYAGMHKIAERQLARRAEKLRRLRLVADFDGSLLARFEVYAEPKHPIAFVVDQRGRALGPYRDLGAVMGALAHARSFASSAK
jgi:hypothetical protein